MQTLTNALRLKPGEAAVWAVEILVRIQPAVDAAAPFAQSPIFTDVEVDAAARKLKSSLQRGQWPVLSELLDELAKTRRQRVQAAQQDLQRPALAAQARRHPQDNARSAAWASVVQDVLDGKLPSDLTSNQQRAEVERRLAAKGAK